MRRPNIGEASAPAHMTAEVEKENCNRLQPNSLITGSISIDSGPMSSMLLPNSCPIRQMPAIFNLRSEKSDSTVATTDMHFPSLFLGMMLSSCYHTKSGALHLFTPTGPSAYTTNYRGMDANLLALRSRSAAEAAALLQFI